MNNNPRITEKYLSEILDSLDDAVIVISGPECLIEYANKALEPVLGYEPAKILNKSIMPFFSKESDFRSFCSKVIETNGNFTARYDLASKMNGRVAAEIRCYPVAGESGNPGLTAVVIRDITSKVSPGLEKGTKQIQALQMYRMEAIGRFTAGLAHDFNNLLTGIQGFSKLALHRVKNDDLLKDDLEEIYKAAERTGILTRQLLFFSRKQPMKSRNFLINHTISNMSNIMKWLVGENIKVITELAADTGLIYGDEIKIEQVIINMLLNSRDAMPSGGNISVKTEITDTSRGGNDSSPEAKKGNYVCITIKDSGTGMDNETLGHIFEPFFTTKEMKKGVGLGLFVAYGIIKQHEGWIDYDSAPGKGTVFKIYLPAGIKDDKQPLEQSAVIADYHGNGERILIVEDDNSVRKFASQTLSMFGYRVFEAESGRDAGEMFKREKGDFDLLLVDVVLSDMTGIELVDGLQREKQNLNVILTSGYTDNKAEVQAVRGKGYKFVQKPYSVEDLLHCVKEAIIKHA